MQNARLDEAQAGSKTAGRNVSNLRYAYTTTLKAESEEELKSLLMKVKEESEKAGSKLNVQKWRSWHPVPSLHGKYMGKQWNQWETRLFLGRKAMTNLHSILKGRDITLLTKICLVKAMVFPRVMLWKWEVDHKESWAPKNWCFSTAVLEKTLESPLDCKIKPVNPKGNQSWIFPGRTEAEAEAPILWPPDEKSRLIRKDPDAGKDWRQEKGTTEDEMVGWHHRLDGLEFNKFREKVKDREGQSVAVHRVTKSRTRLRDWTTTTYEGHLPVRPDFMVGESGVIIPTATGCGNEIKRV